MKSLGENIYNFEVQSITGEVLRLSKFEGRVLLIVNVASNCGFTSQYASLQKLYEKYRDKGFSILAFPSNDFGAQEPGANKDIKFFCHNNFNVTFDLFNKASVLGPEKLDLYKYIYDFGLRHQGTGGFGSKIFRLVKWILHRTKGNRVPEKNEAQWNFHKFLIGKNGQPVASFLSEVDPGSNLLLQKLEKELSK
jgi:glutathione peroxidase